MLSRMMISTFLICISVILSACSENADVGQLDENLTANENMTVYFYYSPECHFCEIVKPYIESLSSEGISFDYCNVKDLTNCSQISVKLMKEHGISGIPAVIAVNASVQEAMVGWKKVCELGYFLESSGVTIPVMTCNNRTYTVQECIDCHRLRELNPPSEFDCALCPEV